ncbi:MAG: hypothetical protein WC269_02460, partial [Candidatus Gracilibacteria bacterium]
GFRLKGKGAQYKGELLNFSEVKEFYHKDEKLIFVTFTKEKYVMMDMGTLFDHFLADIYKARNEFLMDALFMKHGKLKAEFDGSFERLSKFGKLINKAPAKIRLYESSMVIIPEIMDAFAVHYDFVNFYEFDEMDYNLKIVNDDETTLFISQLGNDYELFQEKMDELLGGMYEFIVNEVLKLAFPYFHSQVLLKLAYKMKNGKAVSLKEIAKMDKELPAAVEEFIFQDKQFAEKIKVLKDMAEPENIYYGIAQDKAVKGGFIKWVMIAIPEKNAVAFSILPRWKEGKETIAEPIIKDFHDVFFYKIIMEHGIPADKIMDKVREIEQTLVILNFTKDPCHKDKRELRHSPYQYAIRKMPFLRILRKSYFGRVSEKEVLEWQKKAKEMLDKTTL